MMVPDWLMMVPCRLLEVLRGLGWFSIFLGQFLCFFFQGSRLFFLVAECFFMVFQGSRLVFHSFRWVLLVIQGSRVVFHGSRWVLWFFKVPGWLFIVQGRFLWLQVWFSWFQVDFYRHEWSQVGLNPSWAPQARSETLRTPQKVPAWSVSWPHDPARPCRP